MSRNLEKLFYPKSIAILGASQTNGSVGFRLMENLTQCQFEGQIYPINPKYKQCFGLKCYATINDLKCIPDLVIIAIPAKFVFDNIKICAEMGIKNFYIISSGFGETSSEGKELEKEIQNFALTNNLNIVGPNTIGFVNNSIKLNANFSQSKCNNGNAVLISQSGALASGLINIFANSEIGLALGISIGNSCDVSVNDLIEFFSKKKDIKQILLYLESIPKPKQFMEVCKKCTKKIICIKSGRSEQGAKAASSHTGALASTDVIVDTFLKQCNVIRVQSIDEMVQVASIFTTFNTKSKIKNVAIITNAGGPAIMTVDKLSQDKFTLYEFSKKYKDYMRSYLQSQASVNNPIDMVASASIEDYKKTLELCLNNPKIDAIICIHLYIMGTKSIEIAQLLNELKQKYPSKILLTTFITNAEELKLIKHKINYPLFHSGEEACNALKLINQSGPIKNCDCLNLKFNTKIQNIIKIAQSQNRDMLTTHESLQVLKELNLPLLDYGFAMNKKECLKIAKKIGYPIAIKITSKTITHKSDVGGVKVGISNEKQLKIAINEIYNNLEKLNIQDQLDGFIVQEMKSSKREFVYGITEDNQFGLCSMFGLGGIFVEAINDVSFRILPLSRDEINKQINSIKSSKLLSKIRNLSSVNLEQLLTTLELVNAFALTYNIKELDLNPILIDDKNGIISLIDARIKI